MVAMVRDEPVGCWPYPTQRRRAHHPCQPAPARQYAQNGNPAEEARVPAPVGCLDVHTLVELFDREGRFRRHGRVVIIAELQPMVTVPTGDRLL